MKTKVLSALLVLILAPTIALAARPSITSLQQQINQLNARVNDLEAQQLTPVAKLYAGDVLLGYRSLTKAVQGENIFLYEPISGYFLTLTDTTDGGTSTYFLSTSDIAYETFDCTGTGLVPTADGESDTRNVLIGNGTDFYRTTGTYLRVPPLFPLINSHRDKTTGACLPNGGAGGTNAGISMVEIVAYPLPYSLPITAPAAHGLRLEYVAP